MHNVMHTVWNVHIVHGQNRYKMCKLRETLAMDINSRRYHVYSWEPSPSSSYQTCACKCTTVYTADSARAAGVLPIMAYQNTHTLQCFYLSLHYTVLWAACETSKHLTCFLSSPLGPTGAEIDCVDKYGNTPLHVAAKYGHELLISTLMTNGADTAR